MAQDQAQLLYNSIPLTNRGKLDSKVDAKHGGVQIHLGEIANSMDEWEGSVADALGLTNVDVANIKGRHRDKLSLQTRAALQKWQEKHGVVATYRNLILAFLQAGKSSYAEAVCKVLGGDDTVPKPVTPSGMQAPARTSGATAQGTRLRTNPHYHGVYFFLTPYAVHWKDIGTALGFLPNELSMIQSNPMLMMQGATGYLGEMLTKWLQRAPGDGRGSRNFATFEELHDALLKVPGVASIAYDLGQALGIQGGNVQPQQTSGTNVYAAQQYGTMPTGIHVQSGNVLPQQTSGTNIYATQQYGTTGMQQINPQQPPVGSLPPHVASLPDSRFMPGPVSPAERRLEMSDCFKITRFINELENEVIIELGQALGLSRSKLRRMRNMPGDMVAAWLCQEDNVIRTSGDPTWPTLATALDSIGQGGTAMTIRRAHKICVQKEHVPQTSTSQKVSKGRMAHDYYPTDETLVGKEEQKHQEFIKWLQQVKVGKKDRQLLTERITTLEVFCGLTPQDLRNMKLTLGGRKILEKHLPQTDGVQQQVSLTSVAVKEGRMQRTSPVPTVDEMASGYREEQDSPDFMKWLEQIKVGRKDRQFLKDNGVTSDEKFRTLTPQALLNMKLTLGGRRILEKHLQRTIHNQMPGRRVDVDHDSNLGTDEEEGGHTQKSMRPDELVVVSNDSKETQNENLDQQSIQSSDCNELTHNPQETYSQTDETDEPMKKESSLSSVPFNDSMKPACSNSDTPSELHSGTDEPGDLEIKNAVLNPDQLANSDTAQASPSETDETDDGSKMKKSTLNPDPLFQNQSKGESTKPTVSDLVSQESRSGSNETDKHETIESPPNPDLPPQNQPEGGCAEGAKSDTPQPSHSGPDESSDKSEEKSSLNSDPPLPDHSEDTPQASLPGTDESKKPENINTIPSKDCNTKVLTDDDWSEIVGYLRKMDTNQIRLLGGKLGLDVYKLEKMTTLPDDMVKAWLRREDKVKEKCGDPLTWEALVKALRNNGQSGIADDIHRDKCGQTESDASQQPVPKNGGCTESLTGDDEQKPVQGNSESESDPGSENPLEGDNEVTRTSNFKIYVAATIATVVSVVLLGLTYKYRSRIRGLR